MRKLASLIALPILLLTALMVWGVDNNSPVQIDNTGINIPYRSIRLLGRFPAVIPSSNQFVLSNITVTASQSNMANTLIEVPSRSIFSLGWDTRGNDAAATGRVYVQIAGSIDGNYFKTNVYSISNALGGITALQGGGFQDVDTNQIYRYLAVNQINAVSTNNTTNYFYYQFRAAP